MMKRTNESYVVAGAGKMNATLRWISGGPHEIAASIGKPRGAGVTVYVTSRAEIETVDLTRFLTTFGPEARKSDLRRLRGKVLFTVDGYDDCDLDIFEIPEVRKFYDVLHRAWPCWLFAGHINSCSLRAVALCTLQNLLIMRSARECRIRIPEEELQAFFLHALPAAALLHHLSGTSKRQGIAQVNQVAAYLGVPDN